MKRIIKATFISLLALILSIGCLALAACGEKQTEPEEEEPAAQGNWVDGAYSYENADGESAVFEYSVYVPVAYKAGTSLPLITYIPDSTYAGRGLALTKGAAGIAHWASDEKMSKNPVFFLIFSFTVAGSDVTVEGSEAAQIVNVIDKVVEQYGIDESRLYLTGQSMGGITDFSLNDNYPDKFAATVYVACQPGGEPYDDMYNSILASQKFVNQKFIYIASRLDEKAPYGMDDVEKALADNGVEYAKLYDLDHVDLDATNAKIKTALAEGYDQNFFGFKQITATGVGAAEHMRSFEYCYSLDALYEWLLAQTLPEAVADEA